MKKARNLVTEPIAKTQNLRLKTKGLKPKTKGRRPKFAFFIFQFSICTAFLVLALTLFAQDQKPDQDDVLRVESDLTNLLFTATDKNNRYITNLQEGDLRVLEDGVPQKLFTFQRETDRPLSIAFLIDVSVSQARTLPQERAAARGFIQNVIRSEKDEAAIVPFESYAHLEQPLTSDSSALYRAVENVAVADRAYTGVAPPIQGVASVPAAGQDIPGTTAIWDAIVAACEVVLHSTAAKRRAIVLLTDGNDSSSRVSRRVAVERAVLSDTVIYAIGIGDNKQYEVRKSLLREITQITGGRAFFPKKPDDLRAAFAEIEAELRSQYLVAYSPTNKNHDGAFRTMTIEITNPGLAKQGLKLRYRPGYFAKRVGN